jgi:hypothetical protein
VYRSWKKESGNSCGIIVFKYLTCDSHAVSESEWWIRNFIIASNKRLTDRLCGLVVRVPGYRFGGPGSIPGTTRKKVLGLERGPLSLLSTTEELLERKNSGFCLENREYGRRNPSCRPCGTLYPQKVGNHFADKRWLLGRYSSFADSDLGVILKAN